MRRIVITGLGCVTPIGIGKDNFWKAIKEGKSGVGPITRFDTSDFTSKIFISQFCRSEVQYESHWAISRC